MPPFVRTLVRLDGGGFVLGSQVFYAVVVAKNSFSF
jgi:hypothetical protein